MDDPDKLTEEHLVHTRTLYHPELDRHVTVPRSTARVLERSGWVDDAPPELEADDVDLAREADDQLDDGATPDEPDNLEERDAIEDPAADDQLDG